MKQIDKFWSNCSQVNCLLLVNKLSELNKRVNTEAAAHWCFEAVLKNKKQPLADVLQNRCP